MASRQPPKRKKSVKEMVEEYEEEVIRANKPVRNMTKKEKNSLSADAEINVEVPIDDDPNPCKTINFDIPYQTLIERKEDILNFFGFFTRDGKITSVYEDVEYDNQTDEYTPNPNTNPNVPLYDADLLYIYTLGSHTETQKYDSESQGFYFDETSKDDLTHIKVWDIDYNDETEGSYTNMINEFLEKSKNGTDDYVDLLRRIFSSAVSWIDGFEEFVREDFDRTGYNPAGLRDFITWFICILKYAPTATLTELDIEEEEGASPMPPLRGSHPFLQMMRFILRAYQRKIQQNKKRVNALIKKYGEQVIADAFNNDLDFEGGSSEYDSNVNIMTHQAIVMGDTTLLDNFLKNHIESMERRRTRRGRWERRQRERRGQRAAEEEKVEEKEEVGELLEEKVDDEPRTNDDDERVDMTIQYPKQELLSMRVPDLRKILTDLGGQPYSRPASNVSGGIGRATPLRKEQIIEEILRIQAQRNNNNRRR